MSDELKQSRTQDAWYSYDGPENDVAVATRVRLARNLASFFFPDRLRPDEAQQVQSLVFDAFTHVRNPERYQGLQFSMLDRLGKKIMTERGVFTPDMFQFSGGGGVIRTDGKVCCTINVHDHIRLAAFSSGLCLSETFALCRELDTELQESLQFAASLDFGYLTSSLFDAGSGMKISILLHLPSLAITGRSEKILSQLSQPGCKLKDWYGTGVDAGVPLGAYYLLYNSSSRNGSEEEQIERMENAAHECILLEREMTDDYVSSHSTKLKDSVYRAVAAVKYSRLIDNREGVDLLSKIKWGLNAGIITGVTHTILAGLLYRIQNGHLLYVIRNGTFTFEKDVVGEEMRIHRLRALVIQEELADLSFVT